MLLQIHFPNSVLKATKMQNEKHILRNMLSLNVQNLQNVFVCLQLLLNNRKPFPLLIFVDWFTLGYNIQILGELTTYCQLQCN